MTKHCGIIESIPLLKTINHFRKIDTKIEDASSLVYHRKTDASEDGGRYFWTGAAGIKLQS